MKGSYLRLIDLTLHGELTLLGRGDDVRTLTEALVLRTKTSGYTIKIESLETSSSFEIMFDVIALLSTTGN